LPRPLYLVAGCKLARELPATSRFAYLLAKRPYWLYMIFAQMLRPVRRLGVAFFRLEAAGGLVLLLGTGLALLLANTDWGPARYFPGIWNVELDLGPLHKSLLHWINDGLMALFFLLVGLELKHEVLEGQLASRRQAALPIAGALGGMVLPALLFAAFNHGTPTAGGWGIPMATDIAFALAVVQLLGRRVPTGLKVFLTALAVVDDLGAILVIAVFYTQGLNWAFLGLALAIWGGLLGLNRLGVRHLVAYLLPGIALWYCVLQSGVHATLAGVLLAAAIPVRGALGQPGPAHQLAHGLQGVVTFGIVPLFAFANTGVVLDASVFRELGSPLALGILVGLVVGKPLGIGAAAWGAVRAGWAALPAGVSWRGLWSVGLLAGIGFTISLFITLLALGEHSAGEAVAKLAILLASVVAGTLGYALLRALPERRE
jgi:NhaA family Na+:H+ antiporter